MDQPTANEVVQAESFHDDAENIINENEMILENVKESITDAISSSRSSKKKKKVNFDTIMNWMADNVENNYEKSLIKTAITTLIEDGTIVDKGKGKGESYFLSQKLQPLGETSQPENAVNIDELINNKVRDALKNHDNISPPSKSSENDIINKYVILIDELKSEITYLKEDNAEKLPPFFICDFESPLKI